MVLGVVAWYRDSMMLFDAGSNKSLANVHRKYNRTVFAFRTILLLVVRALEVPHVHIGA